MIADAKMFDQRERRARRFSDAVQHILQDFLPPGRECSRLIDDYLMRLGYERNLEIIEVPPECDALDKLELELRMLEKRTLSTIEAASEVARPRD